MDCYPPTIVPPSSIGTDDNNDYRGIAKRSKRFHYQKNHAPEPRVLLYPTLHNSRSNINKSKSESSSMWEQVGQSKRTLIDPMPAPPRTPPPSRAPRLFCSRSQTIVSPPVPHRVTASMVMGRARHHHSYLRYQHIGPERLQIFRLQLPMELIHGGSSSKLDPIIAQAERYAQDCLPNGWNTALYSLTKQDVAMRDIPGMALRIRPICEYISKAIRTLYGCARVVVDKNQPHILKYSVDSGHTGVELHHDCCDVTANLALSSSGAYEGGGTYIPDIRRVVKLEQGECLLHPGSLVHGGMEVTKGTRYLMVTFTHLK